MCMIDNCDRPEFCCTSMVKARKPHKCGDCRRVIQPGEQYERVFGKWDGQTDSHKTCTHCVEASKWLTRECGGYVFGGIREDLREHWGEEKHYRTRELAKLIWGMKRKWTNRRGGLMPLPVVSEKATVMA